MINPETIEPTMNEWEDPTYLPIRLSAMNALARVGTRTRSYAERKSDLLHAKAGFEMLLPASARLQKADPLPAGLFWTARRIAVGYVEVDEIPIIYSDWEERLELVEGLRLLMMTALCAYQGGEHDHEKVLEAMSRLGNALMCVARHFIDETSDHDPAFPRLIDATLGERASGIARSLFVVVENEWRKPCDRNLSAAA